MMFDASNGRADFNSSVILQRQMTRKELLAFELPWEVWRVSSDGEPLSFRVIFPIRHGEKLIRVILIVYFGPQDGPIKRWELSPYDAPTWSYQKRPEGKHTKQMRKWFSDLTGTTIPTGGDWGDIDAEYDPHNLYAEVICVYRENFVSDDDWNRYRRKFKF